LTASLLLGPLGFLLLLEHDQSLLLLLSLDLRVIVLEHDLHLVLQIDLMTQKVHHRELVELLEHTLGLLGRKRDEDAQVTPALVHSLWETAVVAVETKEVQVVEGEVGLNVCRREEDRGVFGQVNPLLNEAQQGDLQERVRLVHTQEALRQACVLGGDVRSSCRSRRRRGARRRTRRKWAYGISDELKTIV
jgi:hypothetical protein